MPCGFAETAAEQFYVRVKRSVVAVIVITPHLGYEFFAAERDVDVFCKIKKQVVFFRRHFDAPAENINKATSEIYREIAVIDDIAFVLSVFSAAAKYGGDAHHQFTRRKRLYHIIVNSDFKPVNAVVFLSPCGKHNDRNILILSYFTNGGKAVELGHHHVHNYKVEIFGAALCNGVDAVDRLDYLIPFVLSVFFYKSANVRLVVNNKQFCHFLSPLKKFNTRM